MGEIVDPITLQILWSRLISIADQARLDLLRATFSLAMRESGDCNIGVMDAEGNSLAQPANSPPSFICVPQAVKRFLEIFPPETLRPGDALMSNDPWICSGHLSDHTVASPIFREGRLIGFVWGFAHWPDTSGKQIAPDSREIFEEGLRIPPCKIMEEGQLNSLVIEFIRNNNRVPEIVLGDLHAQISANQAAGQRLVDLIGEYGLADLEGLADQIQSVSERAMRAAIQKIPDGEYQGDVVLDGFDEPTIRIVVKILVEGDGINVDYTGSHSQVKRAVNVVPNVTHAYTVYPIKCVIAPDIPINEGSYRPIEVFAPVGSILNPVFPAATGARTLVAHPIHGAIFKALAPALPKGVQAVSGGCPIWSTTWANIGAPNGERFTHIIFLNGGQGASPHQDGNSCTAFPSNVGNTPVEITESETPFRIEKKELRCDSGGPGKYRGGLGQEHHVRVLSEYSAELAFRTGRVRSPETSAEGILGGRPGARGRVALNGDYDVDPTFRAMCKRGDLVVMETPGGGGYGDPLERDRDMVLEDLRDGYISPEAAASVWGLRAESPLQRSKSRE